MFGRAPADPLPGGGAPFGPPPARARHCGRRLPRPAAPRPGYRRSRSCSCLSMEAFCPLRPVTGGCLICKTNAAADIHRCSVAFFCSLRLLPRSLVVEAPYAQIDDCSGHRACLIGGHEGRDVGCLLERRQPPHVGPARNHLLELFFFFQAEDGIRDLTVTGVQTCALPIWNPGETGSPLSRRFRGDERSPG